MVALPSATSLPGAITTPPACMPMERTLAMSTSSYMTIFLLSIAYINIYKGGNMLLVSYLFKLIELLGHVQHSLSCTLNG